MGHESPSISRSDGKDIHAESQTIGEFNANQEINQEAEASEI